MLRDNSQNRAVGHNAIVTCTRWWGRETGRGRAAGGAQARRARPSAVRGRAGAQGGRGGGEGHGSGGKSVAVFPRLVMSRPFHFVFSKGIEAFDTEKAMFEPKVGALC